MSDVFAGLTVSAPEGAYFSAEPVAAGQQDLGAVPILVWTDWNKAVEYYGADALLDGVLDGTSLRVSFQGIARRGKLAKKTDDDIAKAQIDFRPGSRARSESTPASRAARAAREAAEALGDKADAVTELLAKIKSGDLSGVAELVSRMQG